MPPSILLAGLTGYNSLQQQNHLSPEVALGHCPILPNSTRQCTFIHLIGPMV